jgi:hypothetical protein
MARTSATKAAVNVAENVNEEEKSVVTETVKEKPLEDADEINVISLVSNVSYKDKQTGDMYEWDEAGHVEPMTFGTLKNMWRSYKGYFKNMWLKPDDARVINQFGLTKTFAKYEYLMDASNYTKKNINAICDAISETPNGLKFAICDKIKSLVIDGEVTDVSVIKRLENHLKINLIEFL